MELKSHEKLSYRLSLHAAMAPTSPFTVSKICYRKSHRKSEVLSFDSVENRGEY